MITQVRTLAACALLLLLPFCLQAQSPALFWFNGGDVDRNSGPNGWDMAALENAATTMLGSATSIILPVVTSPQTPAVDVEPDGRFDRNDFIRLAQILCQGYTHWVTDAVVYTQGVSTVTNQMTYTTSRMCEQGPRAATVYVNNPYVSPARTRWMVDGVPSASNTLLLAPGSHTLTCEYLPPIGTQWVTLFTETHLVTDLYFTGGIPIFSSDVPDPTTGHRKYTFTSTASTILLHDPQSLSSEDRTKWFNVQYAWHWQVGSNSFNSTGPTSSITVVLPPGPKHTVNLTITASACGLSTDFDNFIDVQYSSTNGSGGYGSPGTGGSSSNTSSNSGGGYSYPGTGGSPMPYSTNSGYSPKDDYNEMSQVDDLVITSIEGALARIEFPATMEGTATMVMSDILGRVVFKDEMWLGAQRVYNIRLGAMSIPSGVYFVRVEGGSMVRMQKVWKK
jgi:hypothetical protein